MLIAGDIIFDETTRNPWVELSVVRMLRSDYAIATLAEPLTKDTEFAAPALQAAGFDAIFLTPNDDFGAARRSQELIESTGVATFGFASNQSPEPIVVGDKAICGITDCEKPGWASLSDSGYVKRCLDAAQRTLVFLHLTQARRSPTAAANLERLQRSTVVSVGGRNPGFPQGQIAPGVFHDARRRRPGRPGLLVDVDGRERRALTQSPRPSAATRFVDRIGEEALLFSLKLSKRADLDSTLFRAPE